MKYIFLLLILNCVLWNAVYCISSSSLIDFVSALQKYFSISSATIAHGIHDINEINLKGIMEIAQLHKSMMRKLWTSHILGTSPNLEIGLESNPLRQLYILPFGDKTAWKKFAKASKPKKSKSVWILLSENNSTHNNSLSLELIAGLGIPFDCEFLIAQPDEDDKLTLTEVFHISAAGPLQTSYFGTWSSKHGSTFPKNGLYNRRRDLQGQTFNVAVADNTLTIMKKSFDGSFIEMEGLFGNTWNILMTYRNFSSLYKIPSMNLHGEHMDSGTWTGIIGMLQSGEVDMSCVDLSMTSDRVEAISFIEPVLDGRRFILINKPDDAITWITFLLPFSWQLWLAIGFVAVLVATLHHCYACEPFAHSSNSTGPRGKLLGRYTSLQVAYFTIGVTYIILLAGYSGSLVSFIACPRLNLPFTNFDEFLQDSTYQFTIKANSSIILSLMESTNIRFKKLYELLKPHLKSLPATNREGMERLCKKSNIAYMSPLYITVTSVANCTIVKIPEAHVRFTKAMATVKNSPYRDMLKHTIRTMRRAGILRRIYSKVFSKTLKSDEVMVSPVSIETVLPLLAVLISAIFISFLILFIELCHAILFSHVQ